MDTITTQTNAMISYLYQIMYEQGELLRKDPTSKATKLHAGNIATLSRTIGALRWQEYERQAFLSAEPEPEPTDEPEAQPQPQQPQGPQAEVAEWDKEREAGEMVA